MAYHRSKPARLTGRDVAIMESLNHARYLTVEALEWMHVPGWQTRWDRHQRQHAGRPYYPGTYMYERLAFLLKNDWIYRIKRVAQYGTERFAPEPDLYGLTEEGARLVSGYLRMPRDTIHYDRKRERSLFTINHTADIGTVYAALRARLQRRAEVQLVDWEGDHLTARAYDRIAVQRMSRAGNMETVKLAVQADATCVLRYPGGQERVFVEVDRGTRPLRTWVEKIQAYAAYQGSPELKARYGARAFTLLAIAPHEAQLQSIMQATASVLGKPSGRYLFALHPDIHPTTIATAWRKLASITPTGHPTRPTITTEPHILIK